MSDQTNKQAEGPERIFLVVGEELLDGEPIDFNRHEILWLANYPGRVADEHDTEYVRRDLFDALQAEHERLWQDRNRLHQDRYDLLGVTSTDGLSSSEWLMRTATAERQRDEAMYDLTAARARITKLEGELRVTKIERNCYRESLDTAGEHMADMLIRERQALGNSGEGGEG